MKVLVIGQGGREHALALALKKSSSVHEVHALPGSDAIGEIATCHDLDPLDLDACVAFAKTMAFDLVVIGPEIPLAQGLSDSLRWAGFKVFGPSREAAKLESSKVYSKQFMIDAGVPTAKSEVVKSVEDVKRALSKFTPPYVLKADGLAAGKGVFICKTVFELIEAAESIFDRNELGEAGSQALLEQFSPGYEISYLVLTNGTDFEPLVLAQDHKRLSDGDEGPNTGGMGVVAPVKIDDELQAQIDRDVILPTLKELQNRELLYRGVVFVGLMITPQGPSVLEYNVRFGDPETQVILPLMDGDWGKTFFEIANGNLPKLAWKKQSACCLVMAAEGYPESAVKGVAIQGLGEKSVEPSQTLASYVLHAGTKKQNGTYVTNGGRVLNVIGLGENLKSAVDLAYAKAKAITWPRMQMRKDIGAKLL